MDDISKSVIALRTDDGIPASRIVPAKVLKVLGAIVVLDLVLVVNYVFSVQRATEHLAHNQSMLKDISSLFGEPAIGSVHLNVAVFANVPTALPREGVRATVPLPEQLLPRLGAWPTRGSLSKCGDNLGLFLRGHLGPALSLASTLIGYCLRGEFRAFRYRHISIIPFPNKERYITHA